MNLILSGAASVRILQAVSKAAKPTAALPLGADGFKLLSVDESVQSRETIRYLCRAALVDHAFIEEEYSWNRMRLLAMDMDSTLITIECIDELADFAGVKQQVAAVTKAAMQDGSVDFAESLLRRVSFLADLDAGILEKVLKERMQLSPGCHALLRVAKASGVHTILASGGFTYFSSHLKDLLGLDESYANELEISNGKLTGRISGDIVGPETKVQIVRRAMQVLKCKPAEMMVIGDGANDVPMMNEAMHSIAYHGKPITVSAARYLIEFGTLEVAVDYFS